MKEDRGFSLINIM